MRSFCLFILLLIVAIFGVMDAALAATVGNPLDLDVPRVSAVLRQEVIDETLDEYEEVVKVKAAVDLELVFNKDLNTTTEVTNAKLSGQWMMLKLGTTLFERVEPYFKIGTCRVDVSWTQNGTHDIEVGSEFGINGLAWGGGVKGIIWDFDDWGIRLTGDVQYRLTEADADKVSVGNLSGIDPNPDFEIREWQASILLSKKFEVPLKQGNIYIVPYTGLSISESTVDLKITNTSDPLQDWTLFDANNDSICGFILGCDIVPSLTSSFIYSIEARLASETALTLGGAMKF